MKICEVFEGIQGEGKYAGYPCLFIRTSGCTRECTFCDTEYHNIGTEVSVSKLVDKIKKSKLNIVVWTGGEPLIHYSEIYNVIEKTKLKEHHLETNGDLINNELEIFDYITISPKILKTCNRIANMNHFHINYDIKVVTDLKINKEMIKYATMLMPITTYSKTDKIIEQKVWNYCVKNNIRFCLRQHIHVWGKKRNK